MLAELPLAVIDGAEYVVRGPATVSACQVGDPLAAQKNLSRFFAPRDGDRDRSAVHRDRGRRVGVPVPATVSACQVGEPLTAQ